MPKEKQSIINKLFNEKTSQKVSHTYHCCRSAASQNLYGRLLSPQKVNFYQRLNRLRITIKWEPITFTKLSECSIQEKCS